MRRFVVADWDWVQRWFDDPTLNRTLGPLDEDWVRHVTTDPDHVQLVIETDDAPVALVGVAWDPDGRSHAITDFAVDPARRRSGLGRLALEASMTGYEHPRTQAWIAFVDPENADAAAFFAAVGWVEQGTSDGMLQFGIAVR